MSRKYSADMNKPPQHRVDTEGRARRAAEAAVRTDHKKAAWTLNFLLYETTQFTYDEATETYVSGAVKGPVAFALEEVLNQTLNATPQMQVTRSLDASSKRVKGHNLNHSYYTLNIPASLLNQAGAGLSITTQLNAIHTAISDAKKPAPSLPQTGSFDRGF